MEEYTHTKKKKKMYRLLEKTPQRGVKSVQYHMQDFSDSNGDIYRWEQTHAEMPP